MQKNNTIEKKKISREFQVIDKTFSHVSTCFPYFSLYYYFIGLRNNFFLFHRKVIESQKKGGHLRSESQSVVKLKIDVSHPGLVPTSLNFRVA